MNYKQCEICHNNICTLCTGHIIPEVPNWQQVIFAIVTVHAEEANLDPKTTAIDKCSCKEHKN